MVRWINSIFERLINFSYLYIRLFYDLFFLVFSFLIFFNINNFFIIDINTNYTNYIIFISFVIGLILYNIIFSYFNVNFFVKITFIFLMNVITCSIFITQDNHQSLIKFCLIYSILLILPRFFTHENISGSNKIMRKIANHKGPILIVGGAGYIGSHLVEILLNNNKKVRVLDNFMYGDSSLKKFLKNKNLEIIKGECTNYSTLIPAMDSCSTVIHLAGLVGDPACTVDDNLTKYTNILSTKLAFLAANSIGVERFIFASSCSVYGVSDKKVNEKSKLNPVSLYAETKIDSEKELLKLGKSSSTSVTILRFATVFGHSLRPRFDLVGNIFALNVASGKDINVFGPQQWRPFIHVYDIARAIQIVINAKKNIVKNEIFNVGDDNLNMTLGELANRTYDAAVKRFPKKNIKSKINLIDGDKADMRNYMVSFKKIKDQLNFTMTKTIELGASEIIINFDNKIYGNPKSSKFSNLLTTKKYLEVYNKKKIKFESIPIYYV